MESSKQIERVKDLAIHMLGRENLAAILLGLGSILFPLGFIYANEHEFSPFETGIARASVILMLTFFLSRLTDSPLDFENPSNFKYLFIRNSLMTLQGFVFSLAQFYLPLPVVSTLNSLSPLFVYIFEYFLHGIALNKKQIIGVFFSFVGVFFIINSSQLILMINPAFEIHSHFDNYRTQDPTVMAVAAVAMVLTMALHAYGVLLTKKLINVNSIQINFFLGVQILIFSGTLYPFGMDERGAEISNASASEMLTAFIMCGLPMTCGQLMYIGALTLSKHFGAVITLQFLGIVFGYCISIFRYNEQVNLIGTIGAVFVVLGIVLVLLARTIQ